MIRVVQALFSLGILAIFNSCSLYTYRPLLTVQVSLPQDSLEKASRSGPALSAMSCFIVVARGIGGDLFSDLDTPGRGHSCMHLNGVGSPMVSYATILSGINMELVQGSYAIDILGFSAPNGDCSGRTVRSLFAAQTPTAFLVGTKSESALSSGATVQITSSYDSNTAQDLSAACALAISNWKYVDGNSQIGINKDATRFADNSRLTSFNSKLYATWQESSSANKQIRVAVYNSLDSSPSWAFVDGNQPTGINKINVRDAITPQLTVYNGKLYAIWDEVNIAGQHQIRVAVYNGNDGSPAWSFVDGNLANGINFLGTKDAQAPQLVVFNSKLYATWQEFNTMNQIRVAVYNGNDSSASWGFVDGGTTVGLNFTPANGAYSPKFSELNSKLYLTWQEANHIRVCSFNGNDSGAVWTFVDGNSSAGLYRNPLESADYPQLTVFSSKLYATWAETLGSTTPQIRVAVYNGNDALPSWSFVDGNASTGLNKLSADNAAFPQLTAYGSTLYLAWREHNSFDSTRVVSYNGNDLSPQWTFVDGNGGEGLSRLLISGTSAPQLTVSSSKLYATWAEGNAMGIFQIRVAVGQ